MQYRPRRVLPFVISVLGLYASAAIFISNYDPISAPQMSKDQVATKQKPVDNPYVGLAWADSDVEWKIDTDCELYNLPDSALFDREAKILKWHTPDSVGDHRFSVRCTDDTGLAVYVDGHIYVMKLEDVTIYPEKANDAQNYEGPKDK